MMINLVAHVNSAGGVPAKELFTGIKVDYDRDCKVGFGEYCQVYMEDTITNTLKERTTGAISLGPVGNLQGSYHFMSLSTWEVVKRRTWKVLPMPMEVIGILNRRAMGGRGGGIDMEDDLEIDIENNHPPVIPDQRVIPYGAQHDPIIQDELVVQPEVMAENGGEEDEEIMDENGRDEIQDIQQMPGVNLPPIQVVGEPAVIEDIDIPNEVQARYNLRMPRPNWRDRYAHVVLTNLTIDKANKLFGSEAAASVMKEVGQMHEKGVWTPIMYDQLTVVEKSKIIRSLLFLKRKRDGRLKARLVADGRMQERSADYDLAAPTVSTESLFMVAIINAYEDRYVVTVDIEGAYLNARMDRQVIVEVQGQVAAILTYLHPREYQEYERNGKVYLKLQKALYGTIEAAKLWYTTLSRYLQRVGFKANDYDLCVFNKVMNSSQVTITLHVDDLMISCVDKTCVDAVLEDLRREYSRINVQDAKILDYLGMIFDYSVKGVVTVGMGDMVEELVLVIGVTEHDHANTPASTNLFEVDDASPLLGASEHKRFHSAVALALYVAKRGRPDILLAVSFLSTRVQKSTLEDFRKLKRLGSYLNSTKSLKLRLSVEGGISIRSHVDASYGVHMDGKSHTGVLIR
jgi:hypothetical protein